jgi:hypothetical protein
VCFAYRRGEKDSNIVHLLFMAHTELKLKLESFDVDGECVAIANEICSCR